MQGPVFLCSSNVYLAIPELREEHSPARVYKTARVVACDWRVVVAARRPVDGAGRRTTEGLVVCDLAIVAVTRCWYHFADTPEYWIDEVRERV